MRGWDGVCGEFGGGGGNKYFFGGPKFRNIPTKVVIAQAPRFAMVYMLVFPVFPYLPYRASPKDPAVLKILRVVNFLQVVPLLSHCDLQLRRTLCRHHFPGFYRQFSSQGRVHGVVNMGGHSNNTTA